MWRSVLLVTSSPSLGLSRSLVACSSISRVDTSLGRGGTNSLKWSRYEADVLPLWVADMDIACPEPVRRAVEMRAAHGIYGYTVASTELKECIAANVAWAWNAREAVPSWIRFHPGLIAGLYHSARLVGREGLVVAPQPVYPPFLNAARDASRLVAVDAGDFDNLENVVATADSPMVLLFCNPHNPTGRVWRLGELERLAHLVETNAESIVAVVSDEVWSGLVYDETQTPFTSLGQLAFSSKTYAPALRDRLIVLTSPSKTYNIASLDFALAVIPNDSLRRRYIRAGRDQAECTPFGFAAAEEIFKSTVPFDPCPDIIRPSSGLCEPWRRNVLGYLAANRDLAVEYIQAHCAPFVSVCAVPEATYLLWLKTHDLSPFPAELLREHFKLGVTDGTPFFATRPSSDYLRLNFGCSRSTLDEALQRLRAACDYRRRTFGAQSDHSH